MKRSMLTPPNPANDGILDEESRVYAAKKCSFGKEFIVIFHDTCREIIEI